MGLIIFNFFTKDSLLMGEDSFFSHFKPSEISILSNKPYSMVLTTESGVRKSVTINILEINYEDIKDVYDLICSKHKKECIEPLIIKDEEVIKRKILLSINITMSDVFKEDEVSITFAMFRSTNHSIADLIYSVIQENFTIIQQELPREGLATIKIKKRSTEE